MQHMFFQEWSLFICWILVMDATEFLASPFFLNHVYFTFVLNFLHSTFDNGD